MYVCQPLVVNVCGVCVWRVCVGDYTQINASIFFILIATTFQLLYHPAFSRVYHVTTGVKNLQNRN